jgi:hypothetical protein
MGLFKGQSLAFFELSPDLARDVNSARSKQEACTGMVLDVATEGGASENLHVTRRQATLSAPQNRLPLVWKKQRGEE